MGACLFMALLWGQDALASPPRSSLPPPATSTTHTAQVAKPVTARVTVDSVAPPRATRGGGGRRARVTFRTRAFSGGVLAVDGTAVALLPVE